MEMVSRGVILRLVVIIIHVQVASTVQLNDTVGQFKVLPRTIDRQPLQPSNPHGLENDHSVASQIIVAEQRGGPFNVLPRTKLAVVFVDRCLPRKGPSWVSSECLTPAVALKSMHIVGRQIGPK